MESYLECCACIIYAPRRALTCNEECLARDTAGSAAQRILECEVCCCDIPYTDGCLTPETVENRYTRHNQWTRVEYVVWSRDSSAVYEYE